MGKLLPKFALSLVALAALTLGSASTAKADIVVMSGVNNQGTDNVLLNDATNVNTVTGSLNNNNVTFGFEATSASGNLNADASGQAVISAGSTNDPFTNISFNLTNNATFTRAVFNLNSLSDGTMTIRVTGINIDGGVFEEIVEIDANGQNFFTVDAISGQRISTITLLAGAGVEFEDLRQVRIGGAGTVTTNPVPEPATMILLGTGLAGVAAKVRKRRKGEPEAV